MQKRHPKCLFTIEEEKAFIQRYMDGESFSDLAQELGTSRFVLWKIATKKYGVKTYQTAGYPRHSLNINTFENIHNEKAMYLLGLIYTDGHIRPDRLALTFSTIDKEQMDNFLGCLGCDKKPYIVEPGTHNNKHRQYQIEIGHRKMVVDLLRFVPALSRDTNAINEEILNSEYFPHFLRGFLDGDGSVGKLGGHIVFSGRMGVLKDLETTLASRYSIPSSGIRKITGSSWGKPLSESNCYHLSYCKSQAKRDMYHLMYDDATYWLDRKKQNLVRFMHTKQQHSSPAVTKRYIGISDDEVAQIEMDVNL